MDSALIAGLRETAYIDLLEYSTKKKSLIKKKVQAHGGLPEFCCTQFHVVFPTSYLQDWDQAMFVNASYVL